MIRAGLAVPLALTTLVTLGCDQIAASRDPSQGAVAACEEIVKARLVSPSSYKRIKGTYSPGEEMTLPLYRLSIDKRHNPHCGDGLCEEAQRFTMYGGARMMLQGEGVKQPTKQQTEARIERLYKDGFAYLQNKPANQRRVALARIEFDAQNRYGALIREVQSCMFAPKDGEVYKTTDAFGNSWNAEMSWSIAGTADNVDLP